MAVVPGGALEGGHEEEDGRRTVGPGLASEQRGGGRQCRLRGQHGLQVTPESRVEVGTRRDALHPQREEVPSTAFRAPPEARA